MRLLRFNNLKIELSTHPRTGVLLAGHTIADLRAGYSRYLIESKKETSGRERGELSIAPHFLSMNTIGKPEIATLHIARNIVTLIAAGKGASAALEATATYLSQLFESDPVAKGPLGEPLFMPLADCKMHAPIRPSKVTVGFGKPAGSQPPPLSLKSNTTISSPLRDIQMPRGITKIQCETKLAIVLGKRCKNVPEDKAYDHVFGYMAANDVSVWNDTSRNMFNTFLPAGPWVTTKDEIKDPMNLRIRTQVNNKPARDTSTKDMPLSIPQLIAYVSSIMQLEPGDMILTGTPKNQPDSVVVPLQLGDSLDSEIEGVAKLHNNIGNDPSK